MECLKIKAIRSLSCINKTAKFVHSMSNAMKIKIPILNHEIYLHIVFLAFSEDFHQTLRFCSSPH